MTVAAFLGQLATGFAFLQPNDAAQSEQATGGIQPQVDMSTCGSDGFGIYKVGTKLSPRFEIQRGSS